VETVLFLVLTTIVTAVIVRMVSRDMGWKNILFFPALFCSAAFILYRAVKKKNGVQTSTASIPVVLTTNKKSHPKNSLFPTPDYECY